MVILLRIFPQCQKLVQMNVIYIHRTLQSFKEWLETKLSIHWLILAIFVFLFHKFHKYFYPDINLRWVLRDNQTAFPFTDWCRGWKNLFGREINKGNGIIITVSSRLQFTLLVFKVIHCHVNLYRLQWTSLLYQLHSSWFN